MDGRSMKIMKTVEVYANNDHDGWYCKVSEFMEFWQELIDKVPVEYMESAQIRCESATHWDCGYMEVNLTYQRLETDEEEEERVLITSTQNSRKEKIEIEEMNRLMSKYRVDTHGMSTGQRHTRREEADDG
tara:strand:+ start:5415 stop:5807 length:393 start_codon:yes stop_codon:yes gene_type:complete